MDLKHSFTVPAPLDQTWAAFEDIESVAGCFPGATVTEMAGDDFKGSCKVKLGPIALVYSGSGTFVDKDRSAGRFVIEAKGKDKRGNGTAGAHVTAQLSEQGTSTQVDVTTDLVVTGKPAQFGRGVMQDVSDKLLQQFVGCLQDRVGAAETAPSGPAGTGTAEQPASVRPTSPGSPSSATSGSGSSGSGDALDLGATVLPVLARTYGKQVAAAVVLLVIGWLLGRRGR